MKTFDEVKKSDLYLAYKYLELKDNKLMEFQINFGNVSLTAMDEKMFSKFKVWAEKFLK